MGAFAMHVYDMLRQGVGVGVCWRGDNCHCVFRPSECVLF